MRKLLAALVAVSFAVPAFAASDASSTTAPPEKPKKEKKICRHVDTTESRLGRIECKTAAQWEAQQLDDSVKLPGQH